MNIVETAQKRYTSKAFDPERKLSADTVQGIRDLLRAAPSSVNSQPWHFIIAASDAGKAQVAKATQGPYAYNGPKVINASHVVVLCARTDLDDAHLAALLAQEDKDGRFTTPEAREGQNKGRSYYVGLHRNEYKDVGLWAEKQVYLALGTLLLGAGALGVDACPMEGFDAAALDAELGLSTKGLRPIVLVALGYHSDADFNAKLPKSRLPAEVLFTEL
ncbi:oxygen-insensitive NAD(P)H nitroreductase [Azonexus sp. IMCC34839]|uniref:oxygen-insensitive NAD(P)H nitroreductase n=1 Tax=Azonexus sp. IMCC34839 TaxID=3133695 RepID=UPI00399B5051